MMPDDVLSPDSTQVPSPIVVHMIGKIFVYHCMESMVCFIAGRTVVVTAGWGQDLAKYVGWAEL